MRKNFFILLFSALFGFGCQSEKKDGLGTNFIESDFKKDIPKNIGLDEDDFKFRELTLDDLLARLEKYGLMLDIPNLVEDNHAITRSDHKSELLTIVSLETDKDFTVDFLPVEDVDFLPVEDVEFLPVEDMELLPVEDNEMMNGFQFIMPPEKFVNLGQKVLSASNINELKFQTC